MTIDGLTLVPVPTVGWAMVILYTVLLRARRHSWGTITPVITLYVMSWVIERPLFLAMALTGVSIILIVWLLNSGGGGGPKRKRRAQKPEKREARDWSGLAVPA